MREYGRDCYSLVTRQYMWHTLGLPFFFPLALFPEFSEDLCDFTKVCSIESGKLKIRVLSKTFCREKEEDIDEKE